MDLSFLSEVFDVEYSRLDFEVDKVALTSREKSAKLLRREGDLLINIPQLSSEEKDQLAPYISDHFDAENRILRQDVEEKSQSISKSYTERREDIIDFFEDILPQQYIFMIKRGLDFRAVIEHEDPSYMEIEEEKKKIIQKIGPDGMYVCNLCTAGYFDEDGGLRDLYVKMELNKQYKRRDFLEEFETLIEDRLLCVFVEHTDEVYDVKQEVRKTLKKYQEQDPAHEFVDIRGIGSNCNDIIDGVIEELEDEILGIDYDRWNVDDRFAVARIHPHSIPPL